MFRQSLGRVIRSLKPKPDAVIIDLPKPRTEFDEALDDICEFIGTSFADAMRRSLEHREYLESLFKEGPYPGGVVRKLTNPIDGGLYEVVKGYRRDEGRIYQIRHNGVVQPQHFTGLLFARKAVVNQIMSQRAQCLSDIASVRDELNQPQAKVA